VSGAAVDDRPPGRRGADRLAVAQGRADVLVEALPYIRRFFGATVVVKYGGAAMTEPALAARFAEDVVLLHAVGLRPVVVHGGGPQIGDLMRRLGMEPEFRDGRRVTDADTLDVARMVLVGKVNREIVAAVNRHGPLAVGLSGEDANFLEAGVLDPGLGFVGEVTHVNRGIIDRLLAEHLIPIISTIGTDEDGQALNINADTVAGAVAAELEAEKLICLSDVPGLLRDATDPASLIDAVTADELGALVADGTVAGGMIPKVEACLAALAGGVRSAHLLDGRIPHVLLLELFTDAGIGTMISARAADRGPTEAT
jgi:acetylglutamate kinase